MSSTPAQAQEQLPACETAVGSASSEFYVTKVSGILDPVVYQHILTELRKAERAGAVGFIIWMDSPASVISDRDFLELSDALQRTKLDTGIWVGSNVGNRGRGNASALGGSAQLTAAVDKLALAPGAVFGDTGPLLEKALFESKFGNDSAYLKDSEYEAEEAFERGLSVGPTQVIADIKQFLALYDSFETLECVNEAGATLRTSVTSTRLSGLTMTSQLFHTASSPEVAYLFFMLGLALLVFEFFTAGIGVAGVVGAGFFLLGSYGLYNLPTRLWAVAAIIIAMLFIAIDIQTNIPRLYSALGAVLIFVSSIFLFGEGIRVATFTLFVVFVSTLIYIYSAMPAMVRARFSTPTIGRSWMVGKSAVALTDLDPEGEVELDGVPWKAFTNRATPISAGDEVRIASVQRLLLEAEPTEGAAKDYRDRS